MNFRAAYNNIECRFLNNVDRQLLFRQEWDLIKAEIQRLGKIEDTVKLTDVSSTKI